MRDPFACSGQVLLRPGREVPLDRGHPWVYRGALQNARGLAGVPVVVRGARGATLGVGLPAARGGSLALRMLTFGEEPWSAVTLGERLGQALALRRRLPLDSEAYRVVHTEGDRLPGMVVDRYGPAAVVEVYEPYWEEVLPLVVEFLVAELGCSGVLLRQGARRGAPVVPVVGDLPTAPLVVKEGRWRLPVDLVTGQKTGLFLDQRDNRRRLSALAAGGEVLNLFSYSGGFAVAALAGGAHRAVNVDASPPALALARTAYGLNGFAVQEEDFLAGDAFTVVRELAAGGRRFDTVVVDPPSFARRREELPGAWRGHRDLHLWALRLLRPGGMLLACSCSALLDRQAFAGTLAAAAAEARRIIQVLQVAGAAPDHPVALACPEMEHLQAWFCRTC